jgi:hypothetical protein
MVGLPGHLGVLGRADRPFCEVGHSLQYSFRSGREERIGSVGIDRERGVFGAVQAGTGDGPTTSAKATGRR